MSSLYSEITRFFEANLQNMLHSLEELVHMESPSLQEMALEGLAAKLRDTFEPLSTSTRMTDGGEFGDHLEIFVDGADTGAVKPALVLCHYDTVWPLGTVADWPFQVHGETATGPGCLDMKASLVLIEYALRAIRELGLPQVRPIHILITSDEEIGSTSSRELILASARCAEHVFVLEPALPGGALKTARKGVARFVLEVEGKAAHAGVDPENGASAILEICEQVRRIATLAAPALGTTINVGTIHGGIAPNVIAPGATAEIDVRVWQAAEERRVAAALKSLKPTLAGTRVRVTPDNDRPPMERTEPVVRLFERAAALAKSFGMQLEEGSTGGGSDANFTASIGVPTLDGLGLIGGGAHATHEFIKTDSIVPRGTLLTHILTRL